MNRDNLPVFVPDKKYSKKYTSNFNIYKTHLYINSHMYELSIARNANNCSMYIPVSNTSIFRSNMQTKSLACTMTLFSSG